MFGVVRCGFCCKMLYTYFCLNVYVAFPFFLPFLCVFYVILLLVVVWFVFWRVVFVFVFATICVVAGGVCICVFVSAFLSLVVFVLGKNINTFEN